MSTPDALSSSPPASPSKHRHRVANMRWQALPSTHLGCHPAFIRLLPSCVPPPTIPSIPASIRGIPQHTELWSACHAGRLTTSRLAAFLGMFESAVGKRLGMPKSLLTHDAARSAWQSVGPGITPLPIELILAQWFASAARVVDAAGLGALATTSHAHTLVFRAGLQPLTPRDVAFFEGMHGSAHAR
ncbi:hypothetical protein EON68_03995, partial [archaeon]